jgi:TatA/E family protein of Tat protein translocase
MFVPQLALFDVGMGELLAIMVIALLLFGGKLPEVARSLGRTVGDFKRSADRLSREFRHEMDAPPRPKPLVRPGQSPNDASATPPERRSIPRDIPPPVTKAEDPPPTPPPSGGAAPGEPTG